MSVAEINAFFTEQGQMALLNTTTLKLRDEGISTPGDLVYFEKDTIAMVVENLRKPGDRIPNPDPTAPPGSMIPRPPYAMSAISQSRLLEATEIVKFYRAIGRPLDAGNMLYDPIIVDFTLQWKALKDRKKETVMEVPKVSKSLPIVKWTEAVDDFLSRTLGVRLIPLSYVTREVDVFVGPPPVREPNKPHSMETGSVEGDLVLMASHSDPNYKEDNAKVYFYLEEALRGSIYAASLKTYQRNKDGRSALISIRNQYAGKDKWEAELRKQDDLIHNRKWRAQSSFSLEKFISQHRNAFVSMQQCAQHVTFQLPNEYTRVGYLLE